MNNEAQSAEEVRAVIARSRPEDYDGHTEFARLTPGERLAWLDAAVVFIEASRRAVPTWGVNEAESPRQRRNDQTVNRE